MEKPLLKYYNGRIPACGAFCGGCPVYTRDKNPCAGAEANIAKCEKCKSFHLCCISRGITHCYQCKTFPCYRFKTFAKSWLKYGQNFIENQQLLKLKGETGFLNHYNSQTIMEPTTLPDRIYRKEPLPGMNEILAFIGEQKAVEAFNALLQFVNTNYNFEQEIYFGGKKFGVMVRFRRSGKTLVSIFPEKNGFSVVLVYGKKEVETFENEKHLFDPYLTDIFDNTHQYHDGRWMLIPLKDSTYLAELEKMIVIKKRPNKKP